MQSLHSTIQGTIFRRAPFRARLLRILMMKILFHPAVLSVALATALSSCTPTAPPTQEDYDPTRYLPPGLRYVDDVAPTVQVDLKYSGQDNFVGRAVDGYRGKRAILRRDAAEALKRAADILCKQGYGLLVWDAYRPMRALRDFRAWSRTPDTSTQAIFYPRITKQGIYDGHYIGDQSEHCWGIAVDLTLTHLATGKQVDMGGRHDFLDPSSATDSPAVTPAQRANRQLLRQAMRAAGFANYSKEWWHYRLSNSEPWTAYDIPVRDDYDTHPSEKSMR